MKNFIHNEENLYQLKNQKIKKKNLFVGLLCFIVVFLVILSGYFLIVIQHLKSNMYILEQKLIKDENTIQLMQKNIDIISQEYLNNQAIEREKYDKDDDIYNNIDIDVISAILGD